METTKASQVVACLTLGLALGCTLPTSLQAQITDLDEFDRCERCTVSAEPVATLGGGARADSFMGGAIAPLSSGGYAVAPVGSTRASIHHADGSLSHFLGRDGEGPGEFQYLTRIGIVGDTVLLSDIERGRLVRYLATGEFLNEVVLSPSDGLFVPLNSQVLVMARSDMSPDRVGLPLHKVDLAESSSVVSFGDNGRAFNVGSPLLNRFVIASAGTPHGGGVLFGRHAELAVEIWDPITLELEARYEGSPDWFRGMGAVFDGRSPPPTILVGVAMDRDRRLWVMTRIADPEWEDYVELGAGVHGYRVIDFDKIRDVRIDVFDLPGRRFVEGIVLDDTRVGLFVDREGRAFLYENYLNEVSGIESATVSRLSLTGAER